MEHTKSYTKEQKYCFQNQRLLSPLPDYSKYCQWDPNPDTGLKEDSSQYQYQQESEPQSEI